MISLLFNYFAKKYEEDETPRLHGVNLNEWRYLGRSKIAFTYSDANHSDEAHLFFFCGINDLDKRKYIIVPDSTTSYIRQRFESHPWVTNTAELWKVNESNLYQVIHTEPSKWLREKMLEEYKCVWSNEKNWWITDENAKYESAKRTQAKKKPKEELEVTPIEDNVVKIEFKKEKDDA